MTVLATEVTVETRVTVVTGYRSDSGDNSESGDEVTVETLVIFVTVVKILTGWSCEYLMLIPLPSRLSVVNHIIKCDKLQALYSSCITCEFVVSPRARLSHSILTQNGYRNKMGIGV